MCSKSCSIYLIIDIDANDSKEMESVIRDMMTNIKNNFSDYKPRITEARGNFTYDLFVEDTP